MMRTIVMRRSAALTLALAATIGGACRKEAGPADEAKALGGQAPEPPTKRIGLFLYTDHTAINASRDGILAYIKEHPDAFGVAPEIVVRTAAADETKLSTFAGYFATESFDVVFAVGTPCGKALAQKSPLSKVVFAAPPDAKLAGIVEDPARPGGMLTGVTFRPPVARILDTIERVWPKAKRIGIPHNPGEHNSRLVVDEFVAEAKRRGLEPVVRPVHSSDEVKNVADVLVRSSDVIFAANDNTVHTAFGALLASANSRLVPVVSVDRGSVERGAVWSVGGDYFEIGRIAGELGERLVRGASPSETPVVEATRAGRLYVNAEVAGRLGVVLPADLGDAEVVR